MFDLAMFLEKNLKRKNFEAYGNNWFFCYDWENRKLYIDFTHSDEQCDVYFEDIPRCVLDCLRDNNITITDIKNAYVKLGWY